MTKDKPEFPAIVGISFCNTTIKCDAEGCDYTCETESGLENLKQFVNAKCPKCGGVLITERDFEAYANMRIKLDECVVPRSGNPNTKTISLPMYMESDGNGNVSVFPGSHKDSGGS